MKLAVTGCPRNCAESLRARTSASSAIDGGRWEIYVGGAAGAHVRKGDLLATVDDPDVVVTLTGRFMQYYRENANWLERTYAFVPRVGIELLREVIVEDSLGIAADLDARMQAVDRRLPGPVAGGRRAGHPRPVPHLAAARGAAAGAGPMTAVQTRRRRDRLGPLEQIPLGRGPRLRVDGEQVAVFRLRDGAVHARVGAVCPHRGRADRRRSDRRSIVAVPAAPVRLRVRHRLLDDERLRAAGVPGRGRRRRRHRRLSAGDARRHSLRRGSGAAVRLPHQRIAGDPVAERTVAGTRTAHDHRPHLRRARSGRATDLRPAAQDVRPRITASTGSRTGARRTRSSGRRPARQIAKRNLIFSVLSEHIGFSVWSLWSVIVLFLGPEYGHRPGRQVPADRAPDPGRRRAPAAVHVRRGHVRRPELDHRQRPAAAGPDHADRASS